MRIRNKENNLTKIDYLLYILKPAVHKVIRQKWKFAIEAAKWTLW